MSFLFSYLPSTPPTPSSIDSTTNPVTITLAEGKRGGYYARLGRERIYYSAPDLEGLAELIAKNVSLWNGKEIRVVGSDVYVSRRGSNALIPIKGAKKASDRSVRFLEETLPCAISREKRNSEFNVQEEIQANNQLAAERLEQNRRTNQDYSESSKTHYTPPLQQEPVREEVAYQGFRVRKYWE